MHRLRDGVQTLRLLYRIDRPAFLVSAVTSVVQALVYPLILVLVWQAFSLLLAGFGAGQFGGGRAFFLLGCFFGLLLVQTVLQTINDSAGSILRAESAQHVNGQIIAKMSEIPFHLFEDNAFQARYGLLISQASYRPGMLVDAFVGSIAALVGALAIAVTLFLIAPMLDIFLLLLIPLTLVETRYHARVIDLQTNSAPELFRMMHLAQKSIDATWQRDLRVHGSTIVDDEYHFLSQGYLRSVKHLVSRYQAIRLTVGIGVAALVTGAMATVFLQIGQGPSGLGQAAIILPALVMGLGQGRAFSFSWGTLTECLGYLGQVFAFLDQSFEDEAVRPVAAASDSASLAVAA